MSEVTKQGAALHRKPLIFSFSSLSLHVYIYVICKQKLAWTEQGVYTSTSASPHLPSFLSVPLGGLLVMVKTSLMFVSNNLNPNILNPGGNSAESSRESFPEEEGGREGGIGSFFQPFTVFVFLNH